MIAIKIKNDYSFILKYERNNCCNKKEKRKCFFLITVLFFPLFSLSLCFKGAFLRACITNNLRCTNN